MHTDMELWSEVRRRVLTKELSKRAACREYDLGWWTLKKILEHAEPPGYRREKPRQRPKLEAFLPIIQQILQDDAQAPKKQRHTAKRIWERLRDEHGFGGGYSSVKQAVRQWKLSRREVFLPLSHPPGEAQVDFGEATVQLAGEPKKVALFVMTLPYSGAIFVQVFPRECTETFLEGHRQAFEYFSGVPRRISYDNSAIAVIEVLSGRDRKLTKEFLRLESHYLFEHHFCLVRRANEKGHVERLLGCARKNFLVPVPQVESLEVLNDTLRQQCQRDLDVNMAAVQQMWIQLRWVRWPLVHLSVVNRNDMSNCMDASISQRSVSIQLAIKVLPIKPMGQDGRRLGGTPVHRITRSITRLIERVLFCAQPGLLARSNKPIRGQF